MPETTQAKLEAVRDMNRRLRNLQRRLDRAKQQQEREGRPLPETRFARLKADVEALHGEARELDARLDADAR